MLRIRHSLVSLLVLTCTVAAAMAADPKATGQPPMGADEKAMMDKWMAFMTPGEPHKMLANRVGAWDVKVTTWMAPGAPPTTATSTSEMKAIFDGRYIVDTTTGSFMGQPFLGQGMCGYDNLKKKYVSTWIDNMGTGVMVSEGDYDPATKTFTYMGKAPDLMVGKYVNTKMTEKWTGPDQSKVEMFNQGADGKTWNKTMELEYTRRK